ncbi:hypothetical protein [Streptomyces sp. NPDC046805]|uniref:hypothetical protein n=1 Tax=Streptomyces sp. NPDC046805 TaxID=3155134 RepID=UPI0033C1C7E8
MADEQYRWLDSETAERLLRGEPLDVDAAADDASARGQAERLAKALGALSTGATSNDGELPGEEAALAAFRKIHEAAAAERVVSLEHRAGAAARRTALPFESSDAGLVRIGAPDSAARRTSRAGGANGLSRAARARRARWGRPVPLALTAALTAGMVGGVAVAAGTGVLPTPFGDDSPAPAASVSGAVNSRQPLVSPSPDTTPDGTPGASTPGGTGSGTPGSASRGTPGKEKRKPGAPGSEGAGRTGAEWRGAVSSCRDVRDGKQLSPERRRTLDVEAGGATHVWKYCNGVLESADGTPGEKGVTGEGDSQGQLGQDGRSGPGGEDDGPAGKGGGNDHHEDGGAVTSVPSTFVPPLPQQTSLTPAVPLDPTYTAL